MVTKFPEKVGMLHEGEESLRARSIETLEASEDLLTHAVLIERVMDVIDYFCRHYQSENEDQLTIQLLGIRIFNGAASALKLLLSGYYQTSALQQRDLLETIFLLDYFSTNRALIAEWRKSDKRARLKNFRPALIRTALDERDGFKEEKRREAYDVLCELAGHPTQAGFRMLAPVRGEDAHCGPFFEATAFRAVFEELTKHLVQAGGQFTKFFAGKTKEELLMKIDLLELQGQWAERFYGRPFDQSEIDKMRALIATAD